MEIIEENGIEYVKIPRKEYKYNETIWFLVAIYSMIVGIGIGLVW